jgi:glycosyltransferase involved in cell wall biosynthesis
MRILHVVATAARTGVEAVVLELVRVLHEHGTDCAVVCLADGPLVAQLRAINVVCTVIPLRGKADMRAILRLRDHINTYAPQIVHTHGPRAMFIGNSAAVLAHPRPRIITTLYEFSYTKAKDTRLYRLYGALEWLLEKTTTDAMIAISDAVLQDALTARGIARAKLSRIYVSIDAQHFLHVPDPTHIHTARARLLGGDAHDTTLIGAVGRFIPLKNHRTLIAAMPAIRAAVPNAQLVLVGDGDLRAEYQAQAAALGVPLHLPGVQSDMPTVYHALDLMAHPSSTESYGMVALEAILCGTPVVGSAVGGMAEILAQSPTDTRLAAHTIEDPAVWAAAIIARLQGPRNTLSQRQQIAAQFSAQTFLDEHLRVYQAVQNAR